MRTLLVVSKEKDWPCESKIDNFEVITARDYLTQKKYAEIRNGQVFNLCRSYKYQTQGYYVSLLAQARGQKAIPSITTIQDLKSASLFRTLVDDIKGLIQDVFKKEHSSEISLGIYFGKALDPQYSKLAKRIYSLFPAPLLQVKFRKRHRWFLQDISAIPINLIVEEHRTHLKEQAQVFFNKKRHEGKPRIPTLYDLAILVNPEEREPPSNGGAIAGIMEAGEALGFHVELITKEDYHRLSQFDALLIRETTAVNDHTYRFARRAVAEGLVVIDDPDSIVKCANKVYLCEMLQRAHLNIPETIIVHKDNQDSIMGTLGLPCVLKRPDSAFSRGVVKAETPAELETALATFFAESDLVVCQAYLPTAFDWRIGILNRQPLFACQYFMAKNHWQICHWSPDQLKREWGDNRGIPLTQVPDKVLKTALKAANLVGEGLYGVDLKQVGDKVYVIEINDNPNIDEGFENAILGNKLYQILIQTFWDRLEQKRQSWRHIDLNDWIGLKPDKQGKKMSTQLS